MKFTLNSKEYSLDEMSITFDEGEKIEELTGMSYVEAGQAMRQGSLRPIRALMFTAIARIDKDISFDKLGDAQIEKVEFDWDVVEVAEKKEPLETISPTNEMSI